MKRICLLLFMCFVINSSGQDKTEYYIIKYKDFAIMEMNIYGVPASITLAQAILESGNGKSRLSIEGLNHFGIKCHDNWNGEVIFEDDDKEGECFRKYDKVSDSYRDHSLFLTERGRYSFLFEYKRTDYKRWAKGLSSAGYATNPKYSHLLIELIERYHLDEYDKDVLNEKKLFFAHSYGFPYLTGIGVYYFNSRSFYFSEMNSSFAFSEVSLGYNHLLLNDFYIGSNVGVLYNPYSSYVPYFSGEMMYNREVIKRVLIRGGVQFPLLDLNISGNSFNFIPYFRIIYLLP